MSNALILKNLPAPVRSLLRPMLFAAIGLHALLLFTPMPSEEKPKKPDDKENPVKITQLPTAKVAARPKLAKPILPKVDRPKPAVDAPPVPKPPPKPAVSDAGKADTTASKDKDPFADFPHYSGSTPNCYGKTDLGENCREVSTPLVAVASYFEKALADKKFTSASAGGDGIKVKILTVSKGGKSLYLSILKDSERKTVYLLAPEKIDNLDKLKKAESTPKAIADIYAQVENNGNDATPKEFTQPEAYYKDPAASLPEQSDAILGSPKIVEGAKADQVYATLKGYLETNSYTTSEAGVYGGGPLYVIKDASYTGYLNLAPSKSGGTIVVVWTKKPE